MYKITDKGNGFALTVSITGLTESKVKAIKSVLTLWTVEGGFKPMGHTLVFHYEGVEKNVVEDVMSRLSIPKEEKVG